MLNDPKLQSWNPNAEIYRKRTSLMVRIEVAGAVAQDFDLTLNGSRLKVRGTRRVPLEAEDGFVVCNVRYGPFEITLDLPPGYKYDKAKAQYSGGMLQIEIPKDGVELEEKSGVGKDRSKTTPNLVWLPARKSRTNITTHEPKN